MTRYSDREDGVEDPVAYQAAEQLYPRPSGRTGQLAKLDISYQQLIAFENEWSAGLQRKEGAIRSTFNLSALRYYQLVNRMIDDPAALELDPALIYRLRDQRKARLAARNPAHL